MDVEAADSNLATHYKVHRKRLDNELSHGEVYATRRRGQQAATVAQRLAEGEQLDISTDRAAQIRAGYLASRVLLDEPDNARARLLRARAYNNLQIDMLAVQAWADTEIAVNDPVTAQRAHRVRGILLIRAGYPMDAVAELDAALRADPHDLRSMGTRA